MILNRRSPDIFKDVAAFMEIAQPDMIVPEGQIPSEKAIRLAIGLFEEEGIKEYLVALAAYLANPTIENLVAVVDGGMDTIYVIAWAMRAFNIPAQAMWNEIQRSNMAKFPRPEAAFPQSQNIDLPKILDIPEYKDIDIEYTKLKGKWIIRNAKTGKVVKPMGWTQPDLFTILAEHQSIHTLLTQRGGQMANEFLKDYFYEQETKRLSGQVIDT